MRTRESDVLLIFLKNPIEGKVKTRLSKETGDQKALNIYKKLVDLTLSAGNSALFNTRLVYSDFVPDIYPWDYLPGASFETFLQIQEKDLGRRMETALKAALKQFQKVVLIGSDCPEISTAIIQEAFHALSDHSFVVGPANDGGFYLIGITEWRDLLFDQITWSTDGVYNKLVSNAANLGYSVFDQLPTLTDVDDLEDLKKVEYLL
jgi:hypothetical protein